MTLVRDRLYIDNELYVPYEINKDATPRLNEEIRDTPKGVNLGETPPPKRQRQGPSPPKYNTGRQLAYLRQIGTRCKGAIRKYLNNLNKNVKHTNINEICTRCKGAIRKSEQFV